MSNAALKLDSLLPSQEWVRERRYYLGGSDVATVLGLNPYCTPLQLWIHKRGEPRVQDELPITRFGHFFEPILAHHFSEVSGLPVRNVSKTKVHSRYPFLRANVDRIILSNSKHEGTGVLELKTTNSQAVKHWKQGELPQTWQYQVQFYIALCGYEYGYLQCYERDTCVYHDPVYIPRNEALIADMIPTLVNWWQTHMIEGVKPDPTSDEDLLILYPNAVEEQRKAASPIAYEYWESLTKVKAQLKKFKAMEGQLSHLLKQEMGEASSLTYGEKEIVSWKNQTSSRLDQNQLKTAFPEAYNACKTQTTSRRFVVKSP